MSQAPSITLTARETSVLHTEMFGGWYKRLDAPELLAQVPSQARALRVDAIPLGLDTNEISRRFRSVATDVLASLEEPKHTLVCWFQGPIFRGGLSFVYPHLGYASPPYRYNLFGISNLTKDEGYSSGYLSVEFDRCWCVGVMNDPSVDLGITVHMTGALVDEDTASAFLRMTGYKRDTVFDVLKRSACIFNSASHFEGVYLISMNRSVDEMATQVQRGLPPHVTLKRLPGSSSQDS